MLSSASYHSSRPPRLGLSLLEVVLALAILGFAAAYLAQAMRLATNNAIQAQKLTEAEIVVESVMNQVIAGVIPSDPVTWTPYSTSLGQSEWMYQIQNVPTEVENMIGLQVAVRKVDPTAAIASNEVDLYVNRWIIDPTLELDVLPAEEETGSY
ncbi:MAG: prepilin-type N-terminal cleavage/methylation domain-containing protein [Planctomycetales bacterium]|nr:prepilin-type N-terminal cleavage/methylation domain-containing protein [Planctomycetales bacterium]